MDFHFHLHILLIKSIGQIAYNAMNTWNILKFSLSFTSLVSVWTTVYIYLIQFMLQVKTLIVLVIAFSSVSFL